MMRGRGHKIVDGRTLNARDLLTFFSWMAVNQPFLDKGNVQFKPHSVLTLAHVVIHVNLLCFHNARKHQLSLQT